jgi:hypothetical protein
MVTDDERFGGEDGKRLKGGRVGERRWITLSSFLVLGLIPAVLIPQMSLITSGPSMPKAIMYRNESWTE